MNLRLILRGLQEVLGMYDLDDAADKKFGILSDRWA